MRKNLLLKIYEIRPVLMKVIFMAEPPDSKRSLSLLPSFHRVSLTPTSCPPRTIHILRSNIANAHERVFLRPPQRNLRNLSAGLPVIFVVKKRPAADK